MSNLKKGGITVIILMCLILVWLISNLLIDASIAPSQAILIAVSILISNILINLLSVGFIVIMVWFVAELIKFINGK